MRQSSPLVSDSELWKAFRSGSLAAFEQLYSRHSPMLLSYGKRLSADHALVQDAIQDVFIDLWKRHTTLTQPDNVRFYLFRVLRNRLLRHLTTAANPLLHSQEVDNDFDGLSYPSIDVLLTDQETNEHLQNRLHISIDKLPPRQREAIMLAFYHQFSNAEIADIMRINNQSVTNHITRALHTLRDLLTGVF